MLSLGKITQGQHAYYERQVARGEDDYYAGRGEAPGAWVGAGARALGLAGRVSREQFNALIEGRDPQHPAARLRGTPGDPKVAAFDLTFSAPKSVSVLFAIAPEDASGELAGCHEEAVRAALSYLEDTAVRVRRGHGGEHVERGEGLIAAAYRHRMSRALDPQLHTHVVAANLAQGRDGRFTALDSRELYRAAQTAGYLYQAHLRALVSERLGLQWGEVHKGAAELAAVPQRVMEFFSKRRQEMRRAAQAQGLAMDSRAAAELAALVTRERKQYGVQTQTWREEMRLGAGEQGLASSEIRRLLQSGKERVHAAETEDAVVDEQALGERLAGPNGLTEHANTFDERAVLREFAAAARQGVRVGKVRAMSARFTARKDVIATARGGMSTVDLVEEERRLIAAVVGRARECCGVVDSELVGRMLDKAAHPLTAEQAQAVLAVTGSGDGVSTIEALAGTGKTFTAGALREVYGAAEYQVLGVAPTGRAVRELAATGIQARTLDGALADLERYGSGYLAGAVVLFDEAGMAGTRASARLLEAARRVGAKVVAIGDPGQLASVQAGGWLGAIGRHLGVVRLTQVMRQNDLAERRALAALHDGDPRSYLRWAEREGRIETFDDARSAREYALQRWREDARSPAGVEQVVMIARDNELREELNQAARELRRERGLLGQEHAYGSLRVAVGERVICRRNDRLLDVDNGTRGTVLHLDAGRVVLDTDSGLQRELPAAYVAEHVEYAYALTGHGMQGGTVQSATVLASPQDLSAGWSYTALSRARGVTRLLVYDGRYTMERNEYAPPDASTTPQGLLAHMERRMSERDDEDLAIEQLPATDEHGGAGRAGDPDLANARALQHEPHQEHAATRAEPDPPPEPTSTRLRELREHMLALQAQIEATPPTSLGRIRGLDARILTLEDTREQLTRRLTELAAEDPHNPHDPERQHLQVARDTCTDQRQSMHTERNKLAHELGEPHETRDERDSLQTALTQLTQEHTTLHQQLVERELKNPSPWVKTTLGERPQKPRQQKPWEKAIRHTTTYRATHDITDPQDPLGPKPTERQQRRDWQRAQNAIENAQQRLQLTPTQDLGIG